MRKIALIFTVLFASISLAPAASDRDNVRLTDIEVVRTGETVAFSFTLHAGSRLTSDTRSLVITPTLQNGEWQQALSQIVVRGKRARSADIRAAIGSNLMEPFYTSNGGSVAYRAVLRFEPWMTGSQLVLRGISAGSGSGTLLDVGLVADNLLPQDGTAPTPGYPGIATVTAPPTTATPASDAQAVLATISAPIAVGAPVPSPGTSYAPPAQTPAPTYTYAPPVTPPAPTPAYTAPVVAPTPAPVAAPAPARKVEYGQSTGGNLASRFAFVRPESEYGWTANTNSNSNSEFNYNMPLVLRRENSSMTNEEFLISQTRDGGLSVQFSQGSKVISREMGDNNRTLVDLISIIRTIESSSDSRVSRVVIVGFASPEGHLDDNQKLALARAMSVRDFILDNSALHSDVVQVHNGSVDWEGLRRMVAGSNMPDKQRVLQVINEVPVWDSGSNRGRHGELMRLNGGSTYNYMMQNFFPKLRQATYIKVYYEPR